MSPSDAVVQEHTLGTIDAGDGLDGLLRMWMGCSSQASTQIRRHHRALFQGPVHEQL